MLSKHLQQ
jgi:hypothetical protein